MLIQNYFGFWNELNEKIIFGGGGGGALKCATPPKIQANACNNNIYASSNDEGIKQKTPPLIGDVSYFRAVDED